MYTVYNALVAMFSFSLSPVHSNPPASWVLISKKSYIDILQTPEHKSTTPMFTPSLPTSPLPGRADSQESEESGHTGSTSNSYFSSLSHTTKNSQIHTTEPGKSGGSDWLKRQSSSNNRLSHSDTSGLTCFKDEDSQDSTSGESGVVSTMLNYLNLSSFFRGNSPSDDRPFEPLSSKQRTQFLSPQEEYKASPKKKLAMSKSYTFGTRGSHSKTPSWHGHTEWEKEQMIRPIRLPITLAPVHLRIQEYDLDKVKAVWDIHEYNDIFVHPSTLPDLFQASNGGKDSYLVLLSTLDMFSKVRVIDTKPSDSAVPSTVHTPTPTSKQSSSQLPERPKKDDHNMLNVISRLSNYEHPTPPAITVSSPASPDNSVTTTVACHLQFATTVRFNNKRKKSSSTTLEEVTTVSREGSSSPTLGNSPYRQTRVTGYLSILPNHVLMSDLLRQQLRVRAGSCVRLSGCRDTWRVNCRQNRVSLYLYPVNRKVLQI